MIRLYFLLLILTLASTVNAQQPFRFTQYFQNTIAINPAVAGSEDFLDVKLGYRQQWTGLDASPQTLYVSAHAPLAARAGEFIYRDNSLRISNPNLYSQAESGRALSSMNQVRHGVGGYVLNDQQDVFQQTLAFATYAAHFPIGARTRLSVGLSGGLRNTRIDLTRLSGDLVGDPTFERYQSQDGNVMKLDLNAGLLLYSESYFVGYSATQLLNESLYPGVDSIDATPSIYHYGLAGLRLKPEQFFAANAGRTGRLRRGRSAAPHPGCQYSLALQELGMGGSILPKHQNPGGYVGIQYQQPV